MPRDVLRGSLHTAMALFVLLSVEAAGAEDWPGWRGPQHNGHSREAAHYVAGSAWPGKPAWEARVGEGAASPVVASGKVYAMGWEGERDHIRCLDAKTGKVLWSTSARSPRYGRHATGDEGMYSGTSATPVFHAGSGTLFTLSCDGQLRALNAADGAVRWELNLYDRYQAPQRPKLTRQGRRDYGYTASPLVHGNWLIVEVGADGGCLMAFDLATGERCWSSEYRGPAGHTGGIAPMTIAGTPCAVVLTQKHLLVVRLDGEHAGRMAATYDWVTDFANNNATPAVHGEHVLITSGYNHEAMVKLRVTLSGAEKVWQSEHYSKVCSPVIHAGRVYFAWQTAQCLDFETGRLLWKGGDYGDAGSVILTKDERLVIFGGNGRLTLAEGAGRSPTVFTRLAETQASAKGDVWPHVAFSDGRLYCKDRYGRLTCYDLAGLDAHP
jgi:outer membrane protein assembly factor BamB